MSRWTQNRRDRENLDREYRAAGINIPLERSRSRSPHSPTNDPQRSPHLLPEEDIGLNNLGVEQENYENEPMYFNRYDDFASDEESLFSESEDINNPSDIGQKLVSWQTEFHISERAMDNLMVWLKEHHFPSLPKHIKTLKASSKLVDVTIQRMDPGHFCYFGLKKMVLHILKKHAHEIPTDNCCQLQFGIDGIPLSRSSGSSFWPILVKIKQFSDVLPVAVYHGHSKPPSVHEFMQDFVQELQTLLTDGLSYANREIKFFVSAFIMDAPAKSFVLDIKVQIVSVCFIYFFI